MNKKFIVVISIAIALTVMCSGALFAAPTGSSMKAHYVNKPITIDSDDLFSAAKPYDVKLIAMEVTNPQGGGGSIPTQDIKTLNSNTRYVLNMSKKVPNLSAKAIHNGKTIAFQLTWDDGSVDVEAAIDTFRDSVALMFPGMHTGGLNPSPLMGAKGEQVNIWQWRADWQAEKDGNRPMNRQPQTEGVHVGMSDSILKAQFPGKPSPDATMVEFVAEGFGTLTKQTQQSVNAKGKHQDSKWTVVFVRDMKSQDMADAIFTPGRQTYVNFALYNGSEKDFDGMKSISVMWTPVMLDPAK
ncbi:nitrate reductase gamma subunit [Candidatus Magnetobacterium bavaricum]|uniref:Nitrate reductase gamma subunit n=1 Tax=Candidatus Magnetobacterium bavaricum TaxID=29290 RepID=A0A0F3GW34_9BACT|nr:nitrate reductase gamma subunit [Candidatus Magnetobacterium bavaricum]